MSDDNANLDGAGFDSLAEAKAKLQESPFFNEMMGTPKQDEPERESPEEETPEAEDLPVLEAEEYESEKEEYEFEEDDVGDNADDDDPGEQGEEPTYYTVTVQGEEYEVTLEELTDGYQRQQDYTRKTQSISEERKALEEAQANLQQERQRYIDINQNILAQHQQALQSYEEVDWDELRQNDPVAYVEKFAERQEIHRKAQETAAQMEQVIAAQNAEHRQQMEQFVQEQAQVLSQAVPEFADPEKRQAFQQSVAEYARSQGYSDAEIGSIVDARNIVVLDKARKYDELMSKKKEVVARKKSPDRPSIRLKSSTTTSEKAKAAKRLDERKAKLRQSGSKRDAQSLIADMLTNNI